MVSPDQQDFDEFDNLLDDGNELSEMPMDDDAGRKKRQMIFYVVLVAMLGLGAAGAWTVFGGSSENVPPPLPAPSMTSDATTSPPQIDGMQPGVPSPEEAAKADARANNQAAGNDMALPPAQPEAAAPQAEAQAQADATTPTAETSAVNGTTAEALPPPADALPPAAPAEAPQAEAQMPPMAAPASVAPAEPAPVATAPEAPIAPLTPETPAAGAAPAPVAEQAAPVSPVAETAPANLAASNVVADPAMATRVEQLETQIKAMNDELVAAKNTIANAPAATNGGDNSALTAQLKDLSDKLERINQQVDSLDQRTTTLATELQNRPAETAKPVVKKTAKKAAVKKPTAKKVVAKPAAKAPVAASRGNSWELRSAQPGVAWLGRVGSDEMARYSVGQTIPGLGVVQDVSIEAGRWIVKTSGGTLRQ